MNDSNTASRCAVCGGTEKEHERPDIRHVYTLNAGELITKEEKARADAQSTPRGSLRVPMGNLNDLVRGPHENTQLGRLVELLIDKGVLSTPDALYVAGMGPKPEPNEGYREPPRFN